MGRKKLLRNYDGEGNLISMECGKCHEMKVVSEFFKSEKKKDGVGTICKECSKKQNEEYRKQNADKIKEQQSEYYKQNVDNIKEQKKEYYKQNVNKIKEQKKEYYKQNTDKRKEYQAEYSKQNADRIKEYMVEYSKQNADKIRVYQAEYRVEYYKQNADRIKEQYNSKVKQALVEIKSYVEKEPQRFNYNPNEEIYGVIYLVYNICSQRYYVGQTTIGFDNRYQSGWIYTHGYKNIVKEDLEKYGEDSFEYTKIFKVAHNQEELDKLEAYYIEYFDSYENGYNETRGNIFTERGKIN